MSKPLRIKRQMLVIAPGFVLEFPEGCPKCLVHSREAELEPWFERSTKEPDRAVYLTHRKSGG
jgi:hypothetical protein